MLDSLIELVKDSNLQKTRKQLLVDLYENGKIGDFLAYCFMSAIIGSDKPAKKQEAELPLDDKADEALENFRVDNGRIMESWGYWPDKEIEEKLKGR